MNSKWEEFKSEPAIVDPFRIRYPKKRFVLLSKTLAKRRGDRVYVNEENVSNIANHV